MAPGKTTCVSNKPVPGGCAFRGAKLALQPITDALHLVHGPMVCQGHGWDSRPTMSAGSTLHRLALSTDIGELDIVFGGDARLTKALDALVARHDPPAIFVYQTCLPGMSGGGACQSPTVSTRRSHNKSAMPARAE
ncbi:hypothetical protein CCR94_21450 [Rhodoblastus sphagnicola]|uniref:Nitrogenase/oxidoreductase component 1 domain-containing protein n=1 Tax=Rhodoblastus sphagnicola TaxID=333368 RepID=A0A2S6MXC2_9HYPH|nr:nitrogenase component 1 [Rhodoblastus sphagnicola]MBB4199328.1 nitrogenase molybdenum-iron protein alpha/beta subunit [Rhodoblastus sphagnicola]PPQ27007.1 hypothetical protein CCR94_21450 [Rhodoblastus sphagnicola]